MDEAVPDPLPPGYRFATYVVQSELPAATLGRVYKALDTSIGEVVALNVLGVELRNAEGTHRMRVALFRARRMNKPQAHEYGEWHGVPFVCVSYIEGVGAAVDVGKA